MQMQLRQKRQPSFNDKKEAEETPSSSTANTSTNNLDSSPHATPPPNKRMTWAAQMPVAQQKQPEPVKKQPMNVIMQGFEQMKVSMAKIHVEMKENMAKMKEQMKESMAKMDAQMKSSQQQFDENVAKMKSQVAKYEQALKRLQNNDEFKMQPIRKTIRLVVENCRTLFTKEKFNVKSDSLEVLQFEWYLAARTVEKGFLGLSLYAKPPAHYKGHYRIEADVNFSVLNTVDDKNLVEETETIYNDHNGKGWTFPEMVAFKDLLDPAKGFLRADGSIEVEVEFIIKSATLDHLV